MCYRIIIAFFCCLLLSSCATWYKRTAEFQNAVAQHNFGEAEKVLTKDKKQATGKNKILYYLNLGYVEFMQNNPIESNKAFETAENLMDEQSKNLLTEVAVLVSNPEIRDYQPEDFEIIMVNFYKAMNYLEMNDMEGAMVEVRKINIKLNKLNDKYPDHKNRYQQDAFAHLLMGLIYDASGDYNNAFIAYRNAYEVYQSDYIKNFGIEVPGQLKSDLMRTAYRCGFTNELKEYEKLFQQEYKPKPSTENGQLIVFWLNGLGPVKAEWALNFIKQERGDGAIVFHNEETGMAFPFFLGTGHSQSDRNSIANLKILRVVFPKYVERVPDFTQGVIQYNNADFRLETAEDINAIAFKTLHDRMLREFSNSLLRVATKQGIQYAASKENQWLGLAVGIANAFTEKADTRNWQTLPYSVSYARIPLNAKENNLELKFTGKKNVQDIKKIMIPGVPNKTRFYVYSTL